MDKSLLLTIVLLSANLHAADSTIFNRVALGDSTKKVVAIFGEPNRLTNEEFGNTKFKALEYDKKTGEPSASFTIDAKDIVISRSNWIEPTKVDLVLKRDFSKANFKKYVPCASQGDDQVLIDRPLGLLIATHNGNVDLLSWSTPDLIDLRIKAFYIKCPKLQR